MKTGFQGTFVISWTQTELDGLWAATLPSVAVGAAWRWTGEAVRVDGPSDVLRLGMADGEEDMRKRAAMVVRRLVGSVQENPVDLEEMDTEEEPLFDQFFEVTDGLHAWTVTMIGTSNPERPLLMFHNDIPPKDANLWIVRHNIDPDEPGQRSPFDRGVICFTPGTMILTPDGTRPVQDLREGDKIQTKDNGAQEVAWIGGRKVTGARLHAMPHLRPIRMFAGALEYDVPDAELLVSPEHRILVKGRVALDLFNTDEVLVAAKDLVNGKSVYSDPTVRQVEYIHLALPSHEIVFANGMETESFHPASTSLRTLEDEQRERLFAAFPDVAVDSSEYGAYARRTVSQSEAAIMGHMVA